MLIDFDKLPNSSKIWIYQSNRKFYTEETPKIERELNEFFTNWKYSHLETSFKIEYDRFIILAINDTNSTISIEILDAMVGFVISLQTDFEIELLDKLNVSFKQGKFVQYKDVKSFQKLLKNKSISANTIVFNNLINTKGELSDNWEIPISESWHNRFLK